MSRVASGREGGLVSSAAITEARSETTSASFSVNSRSLVTRPYSKAARINWSTKASKLAAPDIWDSKNGSPDDNNHRVPTGD